MSIPLVEGKYEAALTSEAGKLAPKVVDEKVFKVLPESSTASIVTDGIEASV